MGVAGDEVGRWVSPPSRGLLRHTEVNRKLVPLPIRLHLLTSVLS